MTRGVVFLVLTFVVKMFKALEKYNVDSSVLLRLFSDEEGFTIIFTGVFFNM